MNTNTVLNKVRELLGMEIKLEQRKLDDGVTIIEADAFEAEAEVYIVTEDEQKIPLPVGEYKMEDGMILVVTEEGVISELKEAEAEEEEVVEEEAKKEYEEKEEEMEKEQPIKKRVESIVKETYFTEIENLKKENAELKAKLETLSTEKNTEEVTTEETTDLKEEVKEEVELSTEDLEPAAKPISFNPENKQKTDKITFGKNRARTTLDRVYERLNK